MKIQSVLSSLIAMGLLVTAIPMLNGCAPNVGGEDYTVYEAHKSSKIYYATVVSVQQVNISGDSQTNQGIGGLLGAVAGGVIGSTIGGGTGRTLATVGGALLGGAAGVGAGELASRQKGLEIIVRYQDGTEESIVQGLKPAIQAGQQVRVLVNSDDSRRVVPQ